MKLDIFKFSQENQSFINYVLNSGIGRSKLVSLCLGKAIADTYTVNTGDVDFMAYFNVTYKTDASILLSDINETFLINIDDTLRYTEKFTAIRYDILCPRDYIMTSKANALIDFFGLSYNLSADEALFIQENWIDINNLLKGFVKLIKEIKNSTGE
jgi:hypothetical protein